MSIYKSHTHGPIPLSEVGKRLMHALRLAINDAIKAGDYNCENKVARARGELAKYMSELEKRQPTAGFNTFMPCPLKAPMTPCLDEKGGIDSAPKTATAKRMNWTYPSVNWTYPSGYERLMEDIRKDILHEANIAMLRGTNKPLMYTGTLKENVIQGTQITGMILDDPINEQELYMSKKAVAARNKAVKIQAAKFIPVGIRFLHGTNLAHVYTYKAKRAAKLTLGQEVIIRNQKGTHVGVVVSLDDAIPHGWILDTLTELTHKVAAL